jgi:hypothetical protein
MPQRDGTGRIDPMQGPAPFEGKPDVTDQSPEDRKTVKMIEDLFTKYKRYRMNFDKTWVENYKFFRGKQWKESRPVYRNSDVLNFTFAAVQTIVPIITDARPNIETIPENPTDFEFSQILNQLLTSKWDRDAFSHIFAEGIVDAMIYGTCITEQPFNADLLHGLGDYEWNTIDPLYCYPDPETRDFNDNHGRGFITAIPTDLAEVKRRYPGKAHLIKSDLADIDRAKTHKLEQDDFRIRSAVDNLTLVQGERPSDSESTPQVLLLTAWLKDESMVEHELMEKDKEGKKISKGFQKRKKYPNGRKVVIANKVLLEDDHNPYVDGKFPFAKMVNYIMPREFWGESEIEQLKGPQRTINKLISHTMDVLDIMGNPVWKNPVGSGVFDETIVNKPGLVIPYNEGSEPHREPGTDVQPSIFQALDRMLPYFDKISGIHDVSQGVLQRSMSGVAIEELQEAAQTRMRLKARNAEPWLTAAGQQFVSRIMQFYSVPRIVRITDNGNSERYFRIAIDEVSDESGETQRVATVQNFEQRRDEDGNDLGMIADDPVQYEIKGNLDVRISVGTTLPFRKAQKKQQAKELFQLGIYDAEDLLTDLEHPRKESVLEKFNRRQEQAAMAEDAAAQQELAFREAELKAKQGAPQPATRPAGPLGAVR